MKRDHDTSFDFYNSRELYNRLEEIYKGICTGKISLPSANTRINSVKEQTNVAKVALAIEVFGSKFGSAKALAFEIRKTPNKTKTIEQNKTQ